MSTAPEEATDQSTSPGPRTAEEDDRDLIPYGTRLGHVAAAGGATTAVTFVEEGGAETTISWEELETRSTQLAHLFRERGLGVGDRLAVCLRNSPAHLLSCFAGWKVGATVVPVRWDLPEWESTRLLAVLQPDLVVDADNAELVEKSRDYPTESLPEVTAPTGWGVCSSGSTGTPKVILQKGPALFEL